MTIAPLPRSRSRRWLLGAGLATTAAALTGCSAAGAIRGLTPSGSYHLEEGVAYGPESRHRLDVYVPRAPVRAGAAPVVVFFYGGSWQRGSRSFYAFVGEALADAGFVAVLPDYRVWPDAGFPTFVEDGARATAWAAAHASAFGGDPRRLVLAGHSAGAHIAALLALDAHYLAAAGAPDVACGMAGLAGPYDFLPLTDPTLRALFAGAASADLTQPIHFVRRDAPPLWLAHGTDDRVVAPRNSILLAARMREAGGRAETALYDGYGHIGILARLAAPVRSSSPLMGDLATFVRNATGTG